MQLVTTLRNGLIALTALLAAATPALAADKVSVRLNWIAGSEHGFFFLAKDKGWFAKEGIDLEIVAGQGSTLVVKTVGNGDNDFGMADGASIARGWEVGVPLVVTAVLLKESPAAIYSPKSKGIVAIKDLCGKRVGVNIKSTTAAQYEAMVRLANLKDCTIEKIPTAAGGSKELLADAVDAAVTFSYEDPVQLQVKGMELNEIIASSFFKLYSLGLVTNQEMVSKKPEVVERFMRATIQSLRYAVAHPDEAVEAFMRSSPQADIDYERAKLKLFNSLLIADDASGQSIGKHDAAGWTSSLDSLLNLGIVKAKIDPTGKVLPLGKI
jgi:NitT/TauT family transport system substrate-binding protein